MSFQGRSFQYGDFTSEMFNLYITSPDGKDVEIDGAGSVNLITEKIMRRMKPYLLYVENDTVLQFKVSIMSPEELSAEDARIASRYLFGTNAYDKLWIVQPDMYDIYFNGIFTNYKTRKVGNQIFGFDADFVCDSPYGWKVSKDTTYNFTGILVDEAISFLNLSDYTGSEQPELIFEITIGSFGGDISIENTSYSTSGLTMSFTGLSAGEVLTIDCGRGIITSSTGLRRMSNFNKYFMKIVHEKNNLVLNGNIETLKITHQDAVKVGG